MVNGQKSSEVKMDNSKHKDAKELDRIEGDRIILHDFSPKGFREIKTVEIITGQKIHIYKIKKTRKGKYLFN